MAHEGSAVPASAKGSWSSFLKSIASFSGDLSSLTAPPFILSPTSLVEYSAYWVSNPALLVAPAQEKDAQKRAMLVLKWFISTLKQQYSSRNESMGSEKKPLNPFLGEVFLAKWEGDEHVGETKLVSEQVSHHPPVTAYCITNEKHGVELQGYNGQKASISRSLTISVKQVGHALLKLKNFDETYLITLPSLHIEGLISGSPYVELNGHSTIVSSSGFTARIDYSGRGWLSGTKNSFSATLHPTQSSGKHDTLYAATGQWSDRFVIKQGPAAAATDHDVDSVVEDFDPAKLPVVPLVVADIEHQDDMESRKAWSKVAEAIKEGDMEVTQREKSIIENQQRDMRKEELEDGKEWERKYFKNLDSQPDFEKLAEAVGEADEKEKTGGFWVWRGEDKK